MDVSRNSRTQVVWRFPVRTSRKQNAGLAIYRVCPGKAAVVTAANDDIAVLLSAAHDIETVIKHKQMIPVAVHDVGDVDPRIAIVF